MPANIYGTGLYGTGLTYGRIAAALSTAQDAAVRETALRVSVIDERVNRWETFTSGVSTHLRGDDYIGQGADGTQQNYAFYRLQSDSVLLPNGNIYRVRVGDGTSLTDFQIYDQTITNPLIAAQWNAWAVLYSGTHYSVRVSNNGNTPHVYHSKSDGLYRDNVLKWAQTDIILIECVLGTFDALFIVVVKSDDYDHRRTMNVYYSGDILTEVPEYDAFNYRWFTVNLTSILRDDASVLRFESMQRYRPRDLNNGESITVATMPDVFDNQGATAPRTIRGLAGQVGHNVIRNLMISAKLSDGYYYLFYREVHRDENSIYTSNESTARWQRSKDGIHWSEPVSAGVGVGNSLLETAGYVWMPAYDSVARRPSTSVTYDITNYVPKGSFDIPRDNQEGSGTLSVANPAGVNDALLPLSDRRLVIEVGLRTASGTYEYTEFNDWWIKRVIQEKDGNINRLTIEFGDIWTRLSSALNDNFNFVGQLKWLDWGTSRRNKAFNYYFRSDTAPVVTDDNRLRTRGIVLYTGWKGQSGSISAHFVSVTGNPSIVFRYIDDRNYQRLEKQGTTLYYIAREDGVDITIDSGPASSDVSPTLKMEFRWEKYWGYVNGVLSLQGVASHKNVSPGYVGFKSTRYTVNDFQFEDWEPPINAPELIKTALAMGDYHDVITGDSTSEELGIIWGPQTDAPTPGAGLLQTLEAMKWQLVWVDHRILVGAFKDLSAVKIIQDRIIKTDYQDEANKRINRAAVDGNEDTWVETDIVDSQQRDRQISAYFDLPELSDQDSTTERAREEIRLGKMGRTPGGDIILYFDVRRMDLITWIDNAGLSQNVRVEGISVEIDQGMKPSQHETLDTSLQT